MLIQIMSEVDNVVFIIIYYHYGRQVTKCSSIRKCRTFATVIKYKILIFEKRSIKCYMQQNKENRPDCKTCVKACLWTCLACIL